MKLIDHIREEISAYYWGKYIEQKQIAYAWRGVDESKFLKMSRKALRSRAKAAFFARKEDA